jgi:hypothetical protein
VDQCLFGYAALTEGEIRAGVRRLADLLEAPAAFPAAQDPPPR